MRQPDEGRMAAPAHVVAGHPRRMPSFVCFALPRVPGTCRLRVIFRQKEDCRRVVQRAMLHTTRFTRAACAAVVTGSAIVAGGSVKCCAGGSLPVPRVDSAEDVVSTRWIKLQTLTYTDKSGKSRKWDMASRTTKPATSCRAGAPSLQGTRQILKLLQRSQDRRVVGLLV